MRRELSIGESFALLKQLAMTCRHLNLLHAATLRIEHILVGNVIVRVVDFPAVTVRICFRTKSIELDWRFNPFIFVTRLN
jgi:hypothetical protein